jgi:benzodiazapine receptor
MNSFLILLLNIAIPHLAGIIGSYFTISSIKTWYIYLNKPSFNPPNWIFSPVWLTLYTLIGISFYLFYKKDQFKSKDVYFLYAFHIFLNCIWSILFFGMHQILFALIDLFFMIIILIPLMKLFYKLNRISFYLLIPYLIWICFAFLLNYNILILN